MGLVGEASVPSRRLGLHFAVSFRSLPVPCGSRVRAALECWLGDAGDAEAGLLSVSGAAAR